MTKKHKWKYRINVRNKILVLVILGISLFVGLGYALIETGLSMVGILEVNKKLFVYWDNVVVTQNSVQADTPTITDTSVAFDIILTQPGDYYEFTLDTNNIGNDKMVSSISNKLDGVEMTSNSLPAYISYSATYSDGVPIAANHLLEAGTAANPTKQTYKVKVEFLDTITQQELENLPVGGLEYSFNFSVTYTQADSNAIPKPVWRILNGKTVDNLSIGDELCLNDQCFNFIRYDGTNDEDVVMLAKWNLKVGNIYDNDARQISGRYTNSDTGYGLQNSETRGQVQGTSTWNGLLPFSATNYWNGNVSSYPADVYDATLITEPDFSTTCNDTDNCWKTPGYSIAYYVEQYKTKLINDYHATIKEARLLTYSEATDSSIGCVASQFSCPTTGNSAFITNASFWLETASDSANVWGVFPSGMFYKYGNNDGNGFGVRPVIVVAKSNI